KPAVKSAPAKAVKSASTSPTAQTEAPVAEPATAKAAPAEATPAPAEPVVEDPVTAKANAEVTQQSEPAQNAARPENAPVSTPVSEPPKVGKGTAKALERVQDVQKMVADARENTAKALERLKTAEGDAQAARLAQETNNSKEARQLVKKAAEELKQARK